mgnify:CR=1 FL=1
MTPTHDPARPLRSDGEATRERLLRSALQLFARQGFAKTSTRELAEAAGANIAAIRYHFGDKAGLYRATFVEPLGDGTADVGRVADTSLDLPGAIRAFYGHFLEPLRRGDEARLCMKLHFRELLEPSGLLCGGIAQSIRPLHDALLQVLCRHLELAEPDEEARRLAIGLAGLGVHLHVGRDVIDELEPQLNAAPDAIDRWVDTLSRFGLSMIEAERRRRAAGHDPLPDLGAAAPPADPFVESRT